MLSILTTDLQAVAQDTRFRRGARLKVACDAGKYYWVSTLAPARDLEGEICAHCFEKGLTIETSGGQAGGQKPKGLPFKRPSGQLW